MTPAEQELLDLKHRLGGLLAGLEGILEDYEGEELDDYKQGKLAAYSLAADRIRDVTSH